MARAIVFGVLLDEAGLAWPGRNQLMIALSEHRPVVLLLRTAPLQRTLRGRRPRVERLDERLFVVHDALTLRTHRLGRRLVRAAAAVDGRWLRRSLRRAGIDDYLFWLTVNDPNLVRGVRDESLIYDCMDPNFLPAGQEQFDRNEFALAGRARVVFASARTLFDRMSAVNRSTYLLPNAAPMSTGQDAAHLPCPPALTVRPGPVVGYLGTVDWRFDVDHVLAAAVALPDTTFVIAGRVNADQEGKVAPLRELPNVVLPGQLSPEEGEAYTTRFDVGIIPFTPSLMNDAINPVKMFMYLARGIPVVSTWIAECRDNPFVEAADSPEAFTEAVRSALADRDPERRRRRIEYAQTNTWRERAATALRILSDHGMLD